jgi:GNAT superfamily N-acetyltransferase
MTEKLSIEPLTPDRWRDLVELFSRPGLSVARGCYCMYYRRSGAPEVPAGVTRSEANKRALKALVDRGVVPGLLGYREGRAIGWVSLGPREHYAKLERSPVMKAVDDEPVWSIICFVVDPKERRAGIAEAMLAGAIAWARRNRVKLLEAYPCDRSGRSADDSMWFGARRMFDRAGFAEVARRKPGRPVVRKALGSGRLSGRTSDREPEGLRGRTSIRKKGAGK